jgi:hypothetical protein
MRVSSRCSAFEKLDVAKWKTSYFEGSGALDKRALKILFDTYWTSSGWRREDEYRVSPEDFAYAKAQGVMFEPIKIEHAQILTRISNAISKLDCRRVADAFLASLSTRRLDLRSVLGSYAVFQHLPHHDPNGVGRRCGICGLDWSVDLENLNVLNFERLKWGGVRHSNPTYAAMDLDLFLQGAPPSPTPEDIRIFRDILSAIESAPRHVTSADLHKCFGRALKSNKAERDVLVTIFGYCGVLETADHPGFSKAFIPVTERGLPHRRFIDMPYPACWWRRDEGINLEAVDEYFGHAL